MIKKQLLTMPISRVTLALNHFLATKQATSPIMEPDVMTTAQNSATIPTTEVGYGYNFTGCKTQAPIRSQGQDRSDHNAGRETQSRPGFAFFNQNWGYVFLRMLPYVMKAIADHLRPHTMCFHP